MLLSDFYSMLGLDSDGTKNIGPNLKNAFFCRNILRDPYVNRAYNMLLNGREDLFNVFLQEQGGKFAEMMDTRNYVYVFNGEGSKAKFYKCLEKKERITVAQARDRGLIPKDYEEKVVRGTLNDNAPYYIFEGYKTPAELENRFVINFDTKQSYCVKIDTLATKEVIQILPKNNSLIFSSYDEVYLTYSELKRIINDCTWKEMLSRYGGIYLIRDIHTGKMYVGSASGKNGIWGRWNNYANNPTGGDDENGNVELVKLIQEEGVEYAYSNFVYSILEVLPILKSNRKILAAERRWKKILGTTCKPFGLNDN